MARIAGVDLPRDKRVEVALTYIYGIGRTRALEILDKLEHRGAVSADGKTGDGAGILIDIPHDFFKAVCDFELPEPGHYAVSNVFLPQKENQRNFCISVFEENIKKLGNARKPEIKNNKPAINSSVKAL